MGVRGGRFQRGGARIRRWDSTISVFLSGKGRARRVGGHVWKGVEMAEIVGFVEDRGDNLLSARLWFTGAVGHDVVYVAISDEIWSC